MEDEDQMIMDNIDEFVNDERKIVSCKWLSLTLSLHVNKTIRLLEEYVKKAEDELNVIYFVGGRKKSDLYMTFQYKLAKQNTLDEVKGTFDEVTTCHIYSIQKSCIKDTDVLYANDVDIIKEHLPQINKYSSIQCDLVKDLGATLAKRTKDNHVPVVNGFHESKDTKPKQIEEVCKPPPVKDVENKPPVNKKGKQKEITTKSFFGKKVSGKKSEAVASKDEKSTSKPDAVIQKPVKTESKSTEATEKSTVKTKSEKGGISNAFSKNKKKDPPKELQASTKSETIKSDSETEDVGMEVDKVSPIKSEERVSKSKKEKTTKKEKEVAPVETEKSKKEVDPVEVKSKMEVAPVEVKSKKEVAPVEVKSKTEIAPVEVEKSKKRKAPAAGSESEEDDDFEKFLRKSTDKNYKSPEKKQSKPKEELDVISENEEVDVIEPTPEPIKKKTKRRRTETKESKKKKEKVDDGDLITKPKDGKDEDVSKEANKKENKVEDIPTGGKRRGRRMVMKSKQYLDEEGFMVTRKECESESFSEESDTEMSEEKMKTLTPERKKEVEKKKVVIDLEKKTKAHMTKPKTQASMMSFFKKK